MGLAKRWDHKLIYELIDPGSSVLDLGCGDGGLLAGLIEKKRVIGQAVETDPECVAMAIQNGVPVYHKNLDHGLPEFISSSYDYAVLEKTLQQLRRPMFVLEEMLRISRLSIVSFPNFNYREVVSQLYQTGRMPVTETLPYRWHDTPNIHLFTLLDFLDWVESRGVEIVGGYANDGFSYRPLSMPDDSSSAEELLFLLKQ
ncbi:MAG: methionine biosynthesis protein MetW [Bacillota bacterium]|nr:methionine biosynthesis protein MetW [Bacillota bacterium]